MRERSFADDDDDGEADVLSQPLIPFPLTSPHCRTGQHAPEMRRHCIRNTREARRDETRRDQSTSRAPARPLLSSLLLFSVIVCVTHPSTIRNRGLPTYLALRTTVGELRILRRSTPSATFVRLVYYDYYDGNLRARVHVHWSGFRSKVCVACVACVHACMRACVGAVVCEPLHQATRDHTN
jgi:hypothetical protein